MSNPADLRSMTELKTFTLNYGVLFNLSESKSQNLFTIQKQYI